MGSKGLRMMLTPPFSGKAEQFCLSAVRNTTNLQIIQAFFTSNLLDRGDELMQYPDQEFSQDNPCIIIRSSPLFDGFDYIYTINIIPNSVEIEDLQRGTMWTLTKEGEDESDYTL